MSASFILGINDSIDGSYNMATEKVYALTGRNVGNLVFHYAVNKILGEDQVTLPWLTPHDRLNAMHKTAVIPCANQLGPHADYGNFASRFEHLTIPLVALGLGAQGHANFDNIPNVPQGSKRWVEQIALHSVSGAPNIGVRGPFTLKVLNEFGLGRNAVVTGCPSLFINPDPDLGAKIEERLSKPFEHIAVAGGNPKWKHLRKIESSLVKAMAETGGTYMVQSPIEFLALARGEHEAVPREVLEEIRDYTCPEMSLDKFVFWARQHVRAFFNVSSWMEHLRTYDFVVGVRIHGVVLGLQAGIPSLCIAHDSRTRELCETMHVPFVLAKDIQKGFEIDDLRKMVSFDGKAFTENRKKLGGVMNTLLEENNIPESAWIKRLMS